MAVISTIDRLALPLQRRMCICHRRNCVVCTSKKTYYVFVGGVRKEVGGCQTCGDPRISCVGCIPAIK